MELLLISLVQREVSDWKPMVMDAWSDYFLKDSGGPDAYGYKWYDSVDAPVYNWIDPVANGHTQIPASQLGDDGYTGPFYLGFDFPYYWYSTNKIWIHYNGAISMSPPTAMYHPSSSGTIAPSPASPNDIVVFLGADLDFTAGGEAYFYTNGLDSAIITFMNVKEWCNTTTNPTSHTVQVILWKDNNGNGHITIQYGKQVGALDNCGFGTQFLVGIENIIAGTNDGLTYISSSLGSPLPDSGDVVIFVRPQTSSYTVTDGGILKVWDGRGKMFHRWVDMKVVPYATFKNYGTDVINSFSMIFRLKDGNNVVYEDTFNFSGTVNSGDTLTVFMNDTLYVFDSLSIGSYGTEVEVSVPGDANLINNLLPVPIETRIITNQDPTYLTWDSDSTSMSVTWWIGGSGGNAGWGSRFVLPADFRVDSVVAFVASSKSGGGQVKVALLPDDGSGYMPDQANPIAISPTINVPNDGNVHPVSVAVGQVFTAGTVLYGAVYQWTDSTGIGYDAGPSREPYSLNAYEFTGSWAVYREAENADFYIRLYGEFVNISERENVETSKRFFFTKGKVIFFNLQKPKFVEIYDALGRRVFSGYVKDRLNLSSFSSGIYVLRMDGTSYKLILR